MKIENTIKKMYKLINRSSEQFKVNIEEITTTNLKLAYYMSWTFVGLVLVAKAIIVNVFDLVDYTSEFFVIVAVGYSFVIRKLMKLDPKENAVLADCAIESLHLIVFIYISVVSLTSLNGNGIIIFPQIAMLLGVLYIHPIKRTLARVTLYTLAYLAITWTFNGAYSFAVEATNCLLGLCTTIVAVACVDNVRTAKYLESAEVKRLATTDGLTKLLNKTQYELQVNQLLHSNKNTYFMMLDIDNFKTVNDSCGHSEGDFVLASLADAIKSSFGDNSIIGRVGGDEFSVTVYDTDDDSVQKLTKSMCDKMNKIEVTSFSGDKFNMSCSVGIVRVKENESLQSIMIRADKVMYSVKKASKNGFKID